MKSDNVDVNCPHERHKGGVHVGLGKEQHVVVDNGKVSLYRVDLKVTFVLD